MTTPDRLLAGRALHEHLKVDPTSRACWERAAAQLREFTSRLQAAREDEARQPALHDLTQAIRDALRESGRQLEAAGFEAPSTLEGWEHLAHLAEMPFETIQSGNFTLADVRAVALAWADRQRMKAKLAAEAGVSAPRQECAPQEDDAPPALTANEAAVLRTLATFDPAELASAARVEAAMDRAERISDRTIRIAIRRLIELGLAERPEGNRSGARLTIAGRRVGRNIAD